MASIAALGIIDAKDATRLRKTGIRTTGALLKRASSRRGRMELAEQTGLPAGQLLRWAHRADLMRVRGIGGEYLALLDATGVDSLNELCRRQAKTLAAAMAEVNEAKRVVRRLPSLPVVEEWVTVANSLEPLVKR